MNLKALRAQFRLDIRDVASPQLFTDSEIDGWFNEAQREACMRADLIHEDEKPRVCQIAVQAGQAAYQLHESVTRVTYASFLATGSTEAPIVLELIDRIELTRRRSDWRTTTEPPRELMQEQRKVRLGCIPQDAGLLTIEGYRMPLELMAREADTPEISGHHHQALVQWALYRAYRRPDVETYSEAASNEALDEFERVFGMRPDADLRQDTEATPQVNKVFLP